MAKEMKYNEYDLFLTKHRVYCDLVHIGRRYILNYLSKAGKNEITLNKSISINSDNGIITIVKVCRCESIYNKGEYFAKLYDKQGKEYILYQFGGYNLIKVIKAFKR